MGYIITTKARKIMVMLVARAYRRSNRWSIKTGSEKVAPLTIHSLQDMAVFSPRNGYWIPPPLQTVNNFLKKPLDFVSFMCYIIRIESKKNKIMTEIELKKQEAKLLLNQQVKIRAPWNANLRGQIATVKAIMADGQTLDVELANGKHAFLDVTFVDEIQERTQFAKTEQSLGPIANSVVQDGI